MPHKKTSRQHFEKYRAIASALGVEHLARMVPATEVHLRAAFEKDQHLNNIALSLWDSRDPFVRMLFRQTGGLPADGWSIAETVSLLKHVAIYYVIGAEPAFPPETESAA